MRFTVSNGLAYHRLVHEPDPYTPHEGQVGPTTGDRGHFNKTHTLQQHHHGHSTDKRSIFPDKDGDRPVSTDGGHIPSIANNDASIDTSTMGTAPFNLNSFPPTQISCEPSHPTPMNHTIPTTMGNARALTTTSK